MSKRKSGGRAAESPSPPAIVCILVVDAIIDEFEVEICCQRTDGVDRVFSIHQALQARTTGRRSRQLGEILDKPPMVEHTIRSLIRWNAAAIANTQLK
jgi:hypothetical protein